MSDTSTMAPAAGAWVFNLGRHDEQTAVATPDAETEAAQESQTAGNEDEDAQAEQMLADAAGTDADDSASSDDDGDGSEQEEPPQQLGDAGRRALDRMKAERTAAKREASEAKRQLAQLQERVQEFEDRDRTELEKATNKAERLADQATKATARAVQAEMKSLAIDKFADPTDATDALMRDPSKYVDGSGDIDTDLIESDLAELLERKPHWARPEPKPDREATPAPAQQEQARPRPKPDPGQGARPTAPPTDFRTADKDTVAAEFARLGYRPRS